ncbi:hypothetical protein I4U23_024254 [Adineta vaga]|nr:hypothetical protein I4U23_024254 [Adineta vaga]
MHFIYSIGGLQTVIIFLGFLLAVSVNAVPTLITVSNEVTELESSTLSKTTPQQIIVDETSAVATTNTTTLSAAGVSIIGRAANTYSTTSSDSTLSGGAIAGVCCKSGKPTGHWEDAKVWVEHK